MKLNDLKEEIKKPVGTVPMRDVLVCVADCLEAMQNCDDEIRATLMKFAEATNQRMTEHAHQINMQWVVIGVMLVAYLGLVIRWSML